MAHKNILKQNFHTHKNNSTQKFHELQYISQKMADAIWLEHSLVKCILENRLSQSLHVVTIKLKAKNATKGQNQGLLANQIGHNMVWGATL